MLLALTACRQPTPKPPADCALAPIVRGMGVREVIDTIGPPTDTNAHLTGKVWIPFYFGNNAAETVFRYKGIGRVIFSNGAYSQPAVYYVECDATEPGYFRR